MSDNKHDRLLPRWLAVVLLFAGAYLAIVVCFEWGARDGARAAHRDRLIAARLEALKNPPKWSQPEEFLGYDAFIEQNRVEGK